MSDFLENLLQKKPINGKINMLFKALKGMKSSDNDQ